MKGETKNKKTTIKSGTRIRVLPLVFLLIFSGCEKVIDVDLNEATPALVIEGNLSRYPEMAEVKISKTSSYFNNKAPGETVTGATVTIKKNGGESFTLSEVENGIYRSKRVALEDNSTYNLIVETGGKIYTASSKLHPTVHIDSLSYYYEDRFSFFDDGYVVQAYFTDPVDVRNYYRIKVYVNGKLKNETDNLFVFTDRFVDGQKLEISLREIDFLVKDTVVVQLISLDKKVYEFYNTFRELLYNNPGSAAPANPETNLSNGALGYFSAYSFDLKSIIIKE